MTTSVAPTILNQLNKCDPNTTHDILRLLEFGTLLLAPKAELIAGGGALYITLTEKAACVLSCNVLTAPGGQETPGVHQIGVGITPLDASATGLLSADGTTITFEKQVNNVSVSYLVAAVAPNASYAAPM